MYLRCVADSVSPFLPTLQAEANGTSIGSTRHIFLSYIAPVHYNALRLDRDQFERRRERTPSDPASMRSLTFASNTH